MALDFWKYEGAGNDFIVIDGRDDNRELRADTIRRMCDRHRGVGADGFIILWNHPKYDFRMRYFNCDGSEAEMCGNGARCVTLFADRLGIGGKQKHFLGNDGEHTAAIVSEDGTSAMVEVGMKDVETFEYRERAFFLDTGVPHYVAFVDDVEDVDVAQVGREIRRNERFNATGGTNVNFVEITGEGTIKIRTYERGVEDETFACGTGAVAAAIAARLYAQGDCDSFTVATRGGELKVGFVTEDNQHFREIRLTGPAREVFKGQYEL